MPKKQLKDSKASAKASSQQYKLTSSKIIKKTNGKAEAMKSDKACTASSKDKAKFTLFYRPNGPNGQFSQWYASPFVDENK